ncbi:MAG TPA: hypothetical protein VJM33_09395 [Microthrixaceae bacterium]|nr:hypothetical protein [Microthrixaceae bacterium]
MIGSTLLGAIEFDNEIRGILVVLVGASVLIGSVYVIIATNTGPRLGFLIAGAALFGWMFLMGSIWWMYGIGLIGRNPSWMPLEINFSRESPVATEVVSDLPPAEDLPEATELIEDYPLMLAMGKAQEGEDWEPESLTQLVTLANSIVTLAPGDITPELRDSISTNAATVFTDNPEIADLWAQGGDGSVATALNEEALAMREEIEGQLNGWCLLSESDPRRGEAVAASDAILIEEKAFGDPTATSSYIVGDVFFLGGKEGCAPGTESSTIEQAWHRIYTTFQAKNPKTYSVVTTVKAEHVEPVAGEAPPPPSAVAGASTVSTVMLRNLGNKRLIPAVFTLFCFIMFVVFVAQLRHRDKIVQQHLEEAAQAGK